MNLRYTTTSVIANFKQVVKESELRLHPLVRHLVDKETLEKMGAKKVGEAWVCSGRGQDSTLSLR